MTEDTQARGRTTGAVVWRATSSADHRVLPDGALDLMWSHGRLVVAGPDTHVTDAGTTPGEVTWGLRFPPGVAAAVLQVPAATLTDSRVALDDLVPGLRARLDPAADPAGMLEEVLRRLWGSTPPDPAALQQAVVLDRLARRGAGVRATAAALGMSERTLRRRSHHAFGYGFRTLARIRRFQRGLDLVRTGRPGAQAAAEAGYADQSHFWRESRHLGGASPAVLAGGADA